MFGTSRPPERTPFNVVPWAIAGVVVLIGIVLVAVLNRKPVANGNTLLPPDPYAASLQFSAIQMSESTSVAGGKSTYIDGRVTNTGAKTVTAATVQVLFGNDEAMPPQVQTVPLALIRTHEPYIDTQSIADAPLKPGDDREFRLAFDDVKPNWNQQLPQIHVVHVSTR
jgi:hypothetical protein